MARFDPKIEVLCDTCGDHDYWEPEFTYDDWSGNSGSYDTTDSAFAGWCKSEGWSADGDKTYCPDCTEAGRVAA